MGRFGKRDKNQDFHKLLCLFLGKPKIFCFLKKKEENTIDRKGVILADKTLIKT